MLWNKEDFIRLVRSEDPPRDMFVELFGLLVGLDQEWAQQGARPGQLSLEDFCFDRLPMHRVRAAGAFHTRPEVILEDNEEYKLFTDGLGRTCKLIKKTANIPLPLDYPVKTIEDWLAIKHMYAYDPARVSPALLDAAKRAQAAGAHIIAPIPGGFDLPRQLLGEEALSYAYYDDPELIHDILDTASGTNYRVLSEISRHVHIDQLSTHEDMAGKTGPLIGPEQVRTFLKPYYRKSWDLLQEQGTRIFSQDSDGNIKPILEALMESGVNLFEPCEPAAGMDIVALREQYGTKAAFMGGIDKHVLRQDKAAIRRELEYKMQPSMRRGGVIFGLDHRIPNGTPLENYVYYVQTAREILDLPPLECGEKGWCPMAM